MVSDLSVSLEAPNGTKYVQPTGLFIGNEWVKPLKGGTITSINPTDEKEIAKVAAATAEDVDVAVKVARKAFKEWRKVSGTERGRMLRSLSYMVERHKYQLATIETWDNGKPYSDSESDVQEVVDVFEYYAGWSDKIHGQVIEATPAKLAYTICEPIGVCGQIIPWNFPLAMAAWKLGPALACGNTVILKPAEQTPLSALVLATLIQKAGFPPGVVNILNGLGKDAGAAIASHTGIDKIAFTGSTNTARLIMKMASVNLKNITLETGGKSPLLVFEDADLEQAVRWSHAGIMSGQGQVCTATSRVLVQEPIYKRFIELFKDRIKSTSVIGDPFKEGTFQGPQVSKAQFERIKSYIATGKTEGATLAYGGKPYKSPSGKGFFIEPTVFTGVTDSMRIFQEEVFGPFVVISSFKDEDEAIARANNTMYGLGSSVFTTDLVRAHRVAREIEAGMVWINSSQDSDFRVPFGGVKQSGIGRELGEAGLAAYSNTKAVHLNMGTTL